MEDKEKIINTLGREDKDKYYVYMLCDGKNQSFYIGKGEGGRIWQHEEGEEAKENEINEFKAELSENLSEEERQMQIDALKRDLSEKYKKIKALGPENVTKVIVKWGLTNHEAYMVESALINMYQFMYEKKLVKGTLTNIANGHRSKKEKENPPYETRAQTLKEFKENCGDPEPYSALLDVYWGNKNYEDKTAKDGCGILFVKINHLYPLCKNHKNEKAAILDAASGFWNVGDNQLEKIEYVFALYQSKIVGIYPVNRDKRNWLKKMEITGIDYHNAVAVLKETRKQLPFVFRKVREKEYKEIDKQLKHGALEKGTYRMFFAATDLTPEQEKKLETMRESFIGRYIKIPRSQRSAVYNFDGNYKFKKDK